MHIVSQVLTKEVQEAINNAFPNETLMAKKESNIFKPQLTQASKPEFGDLQINSALALAKIINKPPRDIAKIIITSLLFTLNKFLIFKIYSLLFSIFSLVITAKKGITDATPTRSITPVKNLVNDKLINFLFSFFLRNNKDFLTSLIICLISF